MAKKSKVKDDTSKVWSVFSVLSALVTANVVKKLLDGGWRMATGKKPPTNPADPAVDTSEAITWAAVSATAIAVARVVANRKAADYYYKSTGKVPPKARTKA